MKLDIHCHYQEVAHKIISSLFQKLIKFMKCHFVPT